MILDPYCSVPISGINEEKCSPSSDIPSVEGGESVSDAIIGGIIAVVIVLIIAMTISFITMVLLVLRNCRRGVSLKNSDKKYVKD